MDAPSEEDVWGEFKSPTEQGDRDGVGVLSATAGFEEADGERDQPRPSVVHQQQPEAQQPDSAAGGKEDEHASSDTASLAGPVIPHPAAAELREESSEMMDVKAAQSPEQKPQRQQQQQQCRYDDNGGSRVDLLKILPSPPSAGNGVITSGGGNLDLFGSMLAAAPESSIRKVPADNSSSSSSSSSGGSSSSGADAAGVPGGASHQGDPPDGLKGASASSDIKRGGGGEDEEGWGLFEQPGPEDRDTTSTPPTSTLAAEKVDGEWIGLIGSGSDQPGEEREGRAAVEDEKYGDEGAVAVGREEHLDTQQQQVLGESLTVDPRRDKAGGDVPVESGASVGATKAAPGGASSSADKKPQEKADQEPRPSDVGGEDMDLRNEEGPREQAPREDDGRPPEPESSADSMHQSAESGSLDDVADFAEETAPVQVALAGDVPGDGAGAPAAMLPPVSASEPSELGTSPSPAAVPGKPEGESGESNVAGSGEGGIPSAVPDATGLAGADVLDWGDFGAPTSAVEAAADGPAAAASFGSADGNNREGLAEEDEAPSASAVPDATGLATAGILDWGNFGAPSSAVEATAVDAPTAASSDNAEGNEREGQAEEGEEPSGSPGPDATGGSAADVLDWGDFGGHNSAVEAAEDGSAAAAFCESAGGHEQEGQAKEGEARSEEQQDGEWSAFEAPTTPSAAQNQDLSEPLPRAADADLPLSPPAAGSGEQEESKGGSPGSPPGTQAREEGAGGSEGLVPSDVGEAGGNAQVEDEQSSEAVEWGGFGEEDEQEETSGPSPEEPSVSCTDGEEETPPDNNEQVLPAAMPELVGGAAGEDGSSSWGAFDAAPPTEAAAEAPTVVAAPAGDLATESEGLAASAAGDVPAAQANERVTEESTASAASPSAAAAEEAEAPPGAVGAGAEGNEVEDESVGVQEPEESEDDWGSDFGDFEEAPTTDEAAPVASTAAPPEAVAFPKPPVNASRSLPAVGPAVGAGGAAAAAAVQRGNPGGTADTIAGDARVAAAGGANPLMLAAMVAVFDEAFSVAAEGGETVASWKLPSVSGGAGEFKCSLDSLADLANLLAHAKPCRSGAPARLDKWAQSCILRGIRPVPDALSLQEDDDSDQDAGHPSRRRGRGGGGGFEAPSSSTPAIPSPRVLPVVETRQPAAVAERAVSSPLASSPDLTRGSSTKTSPRAVSPSSAPRPLPRKASATTERPPPTERVPSPAVLGEAAESAKPTTSRTVSPSSPPPPLPRKASPITVETPPTEPVAGLSAGASSDNIEEVAVVGDPAGSEAKAAAATTTTTPAVIAAEGTAAFAAFPASPEPSGENSASEEDEFVWSEAAAITPEMPRHPPPTVPATPPGVGGGGLGLGFNDNEGSSGDNDNNAPGGVVGGVSAASAEVGADGGGDDDGDWSDDPFDSFQSAPPASSLAPPPPPSSSGLLEGPPLSATTAAFAAADAPPPPAEASPWSLDFLMAAPAKGGPGEGHVSPAPSAGLGAGVSCAGGGGQSGKPLDLVSQALAGFGIAASATPDMSEAKEGDDVFSSFSEGGGVTGAVPSNSNIQGGILSGGGGGGGGLKGERDRVSSVDVSDLLRATRLRGGGRRASRPAEALSAAAEARLSALPDLSYMLSQRIRFPMRAVEPLPATATAPGQGFL